MRISTEASLGTTITVVDSQASRKETVLSGLSQGPQRPRISGAGSLETNAPTRPLQIQQKAGPRLLNQPVGPLDRQKDADVLTTLKRTFQACAAKKMTEQEKQQRLEGEIIAQIAPYEYPRPAPAIPTPKPAGLAALINKVAPPVTRKLQKKPPLHASLKTQAGFHAGHLSASPTSSSGSMSTDNDRGRMRTVFSRFTPDFKAQLKHFWKRDRHDA